MSYGFDEKLRLWRLFVLHGVHGMFPSGVVFKMVGRLELGGHVA